MLVPLKSAQLCLCECTKLNSKPSELYSPSHRLKRHYTQYEPTLQQLKKKYEVAMKEKMLSKLERDRAMGQVTGLQSTLKSMDSFKGGSAKYGKSC